MRHPFSLVFALYPEMPRGRAQGALLQGISTAPLSRDAFAGANLWAMLLRLIVSPQTSLTSGSYGGIAFEVEVELDKAIDCHCSHGSRKGYLL